ncbi:MAG: putative 4-hydroxybenzoate polyprenyltransferase [Acidobacteriota bacterium]|nr:putative 4-hydroxybenzoate polyprenyltransferase [Acidobacteriota bacterium]
MTRRRSQLATVLEMIKFEHTLFALPFAFLGMVLAAEGWPSWRVVGWIVVAMVGARSAAMGFNRLADREIDAQNPRTADRALPAGEVSPAAVRLFVAGSALVMVLAAWRLNPLSLALAPVALIILFGYSYTKRFTVLSHLVLGLALSGAPLGAWIAVRGDVAAAPLLLSLAVLCWVAGFDVLYALQDREFDRRRGLYSIPVTLGERGALWASGLLHLAMLVLLALLPASYPPGLGWGYWLGVAGCAALLAYQHAIVRPGDLSRLDAAFFQANGLLAVWLFVMTALDRLVLA